MPVILSQIFAPSDRIYKDAEGALYHYPRQYFSRITPYDRFIYYRPRGRRSIRPDSACYFGHGILGVPYDDIDDPTHRFVPIYKYEPFPTLVGLRDQFDRYYETESQRPIQAQSAVRTLGEIPYQRILAASNIVSTNISLLPSTEDIVTPGYFGRPIAPPRDPIRRISEIPPGAGYVPHIDHRLDIQESAALQERARGDHQLLLRKIVTTATSRGATFWYNNHIDLVVNFDNERTLIEAKRVKSRICCNLIFG